MLSRTGAVLAWASLVSCGVAHGAAGGAGSAPQPLASADAGVHIGTQRGPLVGEVVLETDDAWLRWLTFDANQLFFVLTQKVHRANSLLTGDAIYGVDLTVRSAEPARLVVPSALPDEASWQATLRAEERNEKLGGTHLDLDDVDFGSPIGSLSAADGNLFWLDSGKLLRTVPWHGPVEEIDGSVDRYELMAGEVLWLNSQTLRRRSSAGGAAKIVTRSVRGMAAFDGDGDGDNQILIAHAEGKQTALFAYDVRTDALRKIGSVAFSATPLAVDSGHVYLGAGEKLVSFSLTSATSTDLSNGSAPSRGSTRDAAPWQSEAPSPRASDPPTRLDTVVIAGPFVLWQLSDSWQLWRRRLDGADQPTIIAPAFRVEVVCDETVMQGESDGTIRALAVADGTQRTIATSSKRAPVRYLFRAADHLYWQAGGTIYRVPFVCAGRNPLPPHGEPPEVSRNGRAYMSGEQ